MKKPLVQITKDDVEKALTNTAWDLGNQVLYDLCSKHPLHKTPQEIIAKVWLIGRSYAAALERRKNKSSDSLGDLFYENKAAPKIKKSKIDDWFARLKKEPTPTNAIETHAKLTKLFHKITELEKRSLASKYLHFHFKNLIFIYDSRSWLEFGRSRPEQENNRRVCHRKNLTKITQISTGVVSGCKKICKRSFASNFRHVKLTKFCFTSQTRRKNDQEFLALDTVA